MRAYTALLLLAGEIAWAQSSSLAVQTVEPRPFGYVIGDRLERRVLVSAPRQYSLDRASLPKSGRVNAWIELGEIALTERSGMNARNYEIGLDYQLLNSPLEVKTLELPPLRLKFVAGSERAEQRVGSWPFTLAPITPETVLARAGLEELRPDRAPTLIDTRAVRLRLALYGTLLGAALLVLGYRRFAAPLLARGPFARAYRELAALSAHAQDPLTYRRALRRMHRAFDESAGRSVFAETLDRFFGERAQAARLRADTNLFFELSRREFFGAGLSADVRSLDWLLALCRRWREVERRAT
jgi:mxaA protein